MARAELRYLDETKTKQELVIFCTDEEFDQLGTKASELTHKHYQEGVARDTCNAEWHQFQMHLLGWSLMQRIEEIKHEGLPIRITSEGNA